MTSTGATGQSTAASGDDLKDRVDAIRYAVVRKLAPGLRHALMGELQAIQLSAEFACRMLRSDADLDEVRASLERIPHQCSDAVKAGRLLIEWLMPEEGTTASVSESVRQCLKLVGEDWFLRGIEATTDLPAADVQGPKTALRELIVTALLVLTDMHDQPVDVQVRVRTVGDHIGIIVQAHAANRTSSIPPIRSYRKLAWADLEVLAGVHGIPCVCGDGTASLEFRRIGVAREGGA
jgi:hypothetical protein